MQPHQPVQEACSHVPGTPGPPWGGIVLGLFIVWQLLYLLGSNLSSLLLFVGRSSPDRPLSAVQAVADVAGAWTKLTGQVQFWQLFAGAPHHSQFLWVELRGAAGPVPLPSEFEHAADEPYLHLPGSGDRLWHIEWVLSRPFVAFDRQSVAQRPEEWDTFLQESIQGHQRAYRNYLAWKQRAYLRARPDATPPREVALAVSVYSLAGARAPERWQVRDWWLRWLPVSSAAGPLEVYRRERQAFTPLDREGTP